MRHDTDVLLRPVHTDDKVAENGDYSCPSVFGDNLSPFSATIVVSVDRPLD